MVGEKLDSQEILNRLMSAYGVSSQKSLAEALAIPANNISGWLQRGSVPGNPIIKCALDTCTDLRWLVTGKFANANFEHMACKRVPSQSEQGRALIEKMLSTGGKAVLQRVIHAYGFTTQKELSEYLGISTGTISTWVRREYFPGDVVIACALDTNVSLSWLATGHETTGPVEEHLDTKKNNTVTIPKLIIKNGNLTPNGDWIVDKSFIPVDVGNPKYIEKTKESWLADFSINLVANGKWVLNIDNNFDVYKVSIQPMSKILVENEVGSFVCEKEQVIAVAKIILTVTYDA